MYFFLFFCKLHYLLVNILVFSNLCGYICKNIHDYILKILVFFRLFIFIKIICKCMEILVFTTFRVTASQFFARTKSDFGRLAGKDEISSKMAGKNFWRGKIWRERNKLYVSLVRKGPQANTAFCFASKSFIVISLTIATLQWHLIAQRYCTIRRHTSQPSLYTSTFNVSVKGRMRAKDGFSLVSNVK